MKKIKILLIPLLMFAWIQTVQANPSPQVFAPEMEFTFKDVYDGESVVHDFVIRNKGNAPLTVVSVNPG